jgi:hypothetical protein
MTTRAKFAQHSDDPECSVCHRLIDPIGFGLESFDAVGRYRTEEYGIPIDSRGVLTFTDVDGPFNGPAELGARLARSDMVRSCFSSQFLRSGEGIADTHGDGCAIATLTNILQKSGGRIEELLVTLVRREGFVTREVIP